MEREKITTFHLARCIGITEKALRNKIYGNIDFTWREVCKIHKLVNPNLTKEELFYKQ